MANTTYATVDELKPRVGIEAGNDDSNTLLQQVLDAAAHIVDTARNPQGCDRLPTGAEAFSATASNATRYFDDPMTGVIEVDDLLTLDGITRNGTALSADDYVTWPYNPGNGPITRILLRSDTLYDPLVLTGANWYGYPNVGRGARMIAVTGTWGYCTQANRPAVVKEATLMQAERLYERISVSPTEMLAAMRDPYRSIDPLVKAVLAPLAYSKRAQYGALV
jgi:hypothetical protein